MATVVGKTSIKIDDLINGTVVSGYVSPTTGNLILVTRGGAEILAGSLSGFGADVRAIIEELNLKAMRTFHAYAAHVGDASPTTLDYVLGGDSVSEGWTGTGTSDTGTAQSVYRQQMARAFNAKSRYGRWVAAGNNWYTSPKFSANDTATEVNHGISLRARQMSAGSAPATATVVCDRIKVHYRLRNVFASASIVIKLDGVTVLDTPTFNNVTGACVNANGHHVVEWDSGELPRGSHTISIEQKTVGAFNGTIQFDGAYFSDGDSESGARLWNASHFGYSWLTYNTNNDVSTNRGYLGAVRQGIVKPRLWVHAHGINEGTDYTAMETHMRQAIQDIWDACDDAGIERCSQALAIPPRTGTKTTEQWDAMRSVYYKVGFELGVAVWDWNFFMGDLADDADDHALSGDGIHPGPTGQRMYGYFLAQRTLANLPATLGLGQIQDQLDSLNSGSVNVGVLDVFGHSYTKMGADDTDYLWDVSLASALTAQLKDAGVSGAALSSGVNTQGGFATMLRALQPSYGSTIGSKWRPPMQGAAAVVIGLNDAGDLRTNTGVNIAECVATWKHNLRVVLSQLQAASVYEAEDGGFPGSFGGSGSWAVFANQQFNSGTGWQQNSSSGATCQVDVPSGWTGGVVAIRFVSSEPGSVSAAAGPVTFTVDGSATTPIGYGSGFNTAEANYTTYNGLDYAAGQMVARFYLPAGAHTIVATSGAGGMSIDAVLVEASTPRPVMWANIAKTPLSTTTTRTAIDAFNSATDAVAAEFGDFAPTIIDIDTPLQGTATDAYFSDGTHPNARGHQVIAELFAAGLRAWTKANPNYIGGGRPFSALSVNGHVANSSGAVTIPTDASTQYEGAGTYTYTIPTDGIVGLFVEGSAPGGGGGSGRRGAAATARCGGGSGGSGGYSEFYIPLADLAGATTLTVTIGTEGQGAAGKTTDDTSGSAGTAGGNLTVVSGITTFLAATGGGPGGGGGSDAAGAAGTAGVGVYPGSVGLASSATAAAGTAAGNPTRCAAQGGSGGGITTANAATAGGAGKSTPGRLIQTVAGGAINGGNGGTPTTPAGQISPGGGGGGGGGGNPAGGVGGNGGNGVRGGGGGGGGGSLNGSASGAGGNGGVGWCRITARY